MMDTRNAEHELNIEISENDVRKGFTKSERVDYIKRLLRIEQAKAKERQTSGTSVENSTEVGRSDEITAAAFGMKKDTMRRELFIADNADLLDPSDFADWDEGKLSTNKAYQRIKEAKARADRERDAARQELDAVQQDLADQRIGEILRELPTGHGNRFSDTSETLKADAIAEAGIPKSQAYDLQKLADNPEVVQAVLDKAAAEAKRRALDGNSRGGKSSQKSDATSDDSEEGGKSYHLRTDEQLAKLAGTSRDTIDAREAVKSGEKQLTVGFWVTPFTEEPPKSHAT